MSIFAPVAVQKMSHPTKIKTITTITANAKGSNKKARRVQYVVTGKLATALTDFAENSGLRETEISRVALFELLQRKGYFIND